MSKYERIEAGQIQVSEWYRNDIEALRAADARYTDLMNMWLDDSRSHEFGPNQAQSSTNKWIGIMEGRPYQEAKYMVADVKVPWVPRQLDEGGRGMAPSVRRPHHQEDTGAAPRSNK